MTATLLPPTFDTPAVSTPGQGVSHELRAVGVVWQRDMIRIRGDRGRIVSTMLQPLLFLFVLGAGLSGVVSSGAHGADYKTFLFPGVIVTGILFTAVFSAITIVWDREFGFLREMLVAPISSSSIVLGKCLAGATIATLQSLILIAIGGLVGVPYWVGTICGLAGIVFVTSFAMTAFGLVLAARVKSVQTLMPLVQMVLLPLTFLSGSLYPLGTGTPTWLNVAARYNPLSYGVAAARSLIATTLPAGSATRHLIKGLTWWGWPVPAWLDAAVVGAMGRCCWSLRVPSSPGRSEPPVQGV